MAKYQYKVQGVDYDVDINEIDGNIAKVSVNGIEFEVEMKENISKARPQVKKVTPVAAPAAPQTAPVAPKAAPAPTGSGKTTSSPLPGTITSVNVKVGDTVAQGDVVVVLEAMKMQNNIEVEATGTVIKVHVSVGDSVMEGAPLITIG